MHEVSELVSNDSVIDASTSVVDGEAPNDLSIVVCNKVCEGTSSFITLNEMDVNSTVISLVDDLDEELLSGTDAIAIKDTEGPDDPSNDELS